MHSKSICVQRCTSRSDLISQDSTGNCREFPKCYNRPSSTVNVNENAKRKQFLQNKKDTLKVILLPTSSSSIFHQNQTLHA